jgi:RimP N-terminal domain
MQEAVTSKVEEAAQRVAQSEGLELVEVEVKGGGNARLVRISIDKPEGVTHADCQTVSDKVGEILEAEDAIPGHYTLEVSSPGVERKLLKPQDYQRRGRRTPHLGRDARGIRGRCDLPGSRTRRNPPASVRPSQEGQPEVRVVARRGRF